MLIWTQHVWVVGTLLLLHKAWDESTGCGDFENFLNTVALDSAPPLFQSQ
jgi:hypothetical protein